MEFSRPRLLVLGGGQLGRMLGPAAARLDIATTVLDPTPACPAAATTDAQIVGSFADYTAVVEAAADVDAVTVEIEHVSTAALRDIASGGIAVHPDAAELETVQDKLAQRRALGEAGVPGPRFEALPDTEDNAERHAAAGRFGLPAVQKLRHGGYDGRGVAVLPGDAQADALLPGASYLEDLVDIDRELSVIVARSVSGATAVYPPFEMEMDPDLNLVRAVLYPARLPEEVLTRAEDVARRAVEALGGGGVHAVELFATRSGEVLVNEIAPRPHNSGHLTIEAAETDQFEQHLRAIFDLPLGSTRMRGPAVMTNIIASGAAGQTAYRGIAEAVTGEGAHVHLYGKRQSRPGRKMGHITVCRDDRDDARRAAEHAAAVLTVTGTAQTGR
jgi:5-(carboxyamino)imidazole ribonucleotide synthase